MFLVCLTPTTSFARLICGDGSPLAGHILWSVCAAAVMLTWLTQSNGYRQALQERAKIPTPSVHLIHHLWRPPDLDSESRKLEGESEAGQQPICCRVIAMST